MNGRELHKMKQELEWVIERLFEDFTAKTGLHIEEVEISHLHSLGDAKLKYKIHLECSL